MCYFPITKNYKIENGKINILWNSSGVPKVGLPVITIPCGKCVECQKKRSAEWATRCLLESSKYNDNCIVTLTYADNPLELNKRHYQLFLKRLRKCIDHPIKFFLSGEYGSHRARPHFHLILFGWKPDDMKLVSDKGTRLYSSKFLEELWGYGFVSVGELSFRSCLYTAKYLQKQNFEDCKSVGIQPPFLAMSKGIALDFSSVDYDVDRIYVAGRSYRVPRYFDRVNEKNGVDLSAVRSKRHSRSLGVVYGCNDVSVEQYERFHDDLASRRIINEERLLRF